MGWILEAVDYIPSPECLEIRLKSWSNCSFGRRNLAWTTLYSLEAMRAWAGKDNQYRMRIMGSRSIHNKKQREAGAAPAPEDLDLVAEDADDVGIAIFAAAIKNGLVPNTLKKKARSRKPKALPAAKKPVNPELLKLFLSGKKKDETLKEPTHDSKRPQLTHGIREEAEDTILPQNYREAEGSRNTGGISYFEEIEDEKEQLFVEGSDHNGEELPTDSESDTSMEGSEGSGLDTGDEGEVEPIP